MQVGAEEAHAMFDEYVGRLKEKAAAKAAQREKEAAEDAEREKDRCAPVHPCAPLDAPLCTFRSMNMFLYVVLLSLLFECASCRKNCAAGEGGR